MSIDDIYGEKVILPQALLRQFFSVTHVTAISICEGMPRRDNTRLPFIVSGAVGRPLLVVATESERRLAGRVAGSGPFL